MIIIVTHFPSAQSFHFQNQSKLANIQVEKVFIIDGTVGLTKWIIDDPCHVHKIVITTNCGAYLFFFLWLSHYQTRRRKP